MLTILNAEGAKVNAFVDNYVVVNAHNYQDTEFSELAGLVNLLENLHTEVVVIECCMFSIDAFEFLENIEKISILSQRSLGGKHYLQVQKYLLN
jgi:hypothetical protein